MSIIQWQAWADAERRDELLVISVDRLLLALSLAAVLWLPLPAGPLAARAHEWAIAAMSVLTLAVLLRTPWPADGALRVLQRWAAPHWTALVGALAAVAIALTGGLSSPLAPVVVLLGVTWRATGARADGEHVWSVGACGAGTYLLGAFVAQPHTPPLELAWMLERGAVLGVLTGWMFRWRMRLGAEMTRRVQRSRSTARWHAQLASLERARGEMLAHVSHELLAPVAAIRSSASLLGELSAARAGAEDDVICETTTATAMVRMISAIVRNTARLELCVQDLLELARLEEDRPALAGRWHSCDALLSRAVELLAPLLESKGQTAQVCLAEPGLLIWGDERRIERVTTNLLANAHKYAGERANIVLCASRDSFGARLEVADDGAGVPPEALARLFDRYYRAPGVPGQGSGLGLAIVQAEVELHGGRVWAESSEGHGCRFVCVFPDPPQTSYLSQQVSEVGT